MNKNPYLIPESVMWLEGLAPANAIVSPMGKDGKERLYDLRDCIPTNDRGNDFFNRAMHDISHMLERDYHLQKQRGINEWMPMDGFKRSKLENNLPEIEKMNDKQMLVESLLDNAKSVDCTFYGSTQKYTYKVPKDWELEEGDFLVVPVKTDRYRVVTVEEVYETVNNPDEIVLKWAVQKIDFEVFVRLTELDKKVGDTLVELEKRKVKRELAKEFAIGLTNDEVKQLESDLGIQVEEIKGE